MNAASAPESDGKADTTHTPAPSRERPYDPARVWYRYARELLPASPGRWLDLGCGRGEFLDRAPGTAALGGLDRSLESARAVRAAGRVGLVADLEAPLPLPSKSLDGASLIEVIEHVIGAEQLVDELARVLRPGAWLIITTPNVAHLTYRWRALTGHPPKQEGYHLRFFTKQTLRACFEERGFRIEARASFGKQALLTRLGRLCGAPAGKKVRYAVPGPLEPLLAQHFVWRLVRDGAPA